MDLVIDALATYRLARLVTRDTLTAELRGRVVRDAYERSGFALGDGTTPLNEWALVPLSDASAPKLATLVTCPWCAAVWVAFGVVAARHIAPRAWAPVARALALSTVAGFVSSVDRTP